MDRLFARIGEAVARRPRAALAVALALAACGAAGATRLEVDNSNEGVFARDDPLVADYRALKRVFGNDEFAVVALEPPGGDAFDPDVLAAVGDLEAAIVRLPHVRRARSLRSARLVEASGAAVDVRPFLPVLPPPPGAREVALRHPRYVGTYVDPAGAVAAIVVDTDVPDTDDQGKLVLAARLRDLLAAPRFAALRPRLAGAPVFEADFDARTAAEGGALFGLSCLVSGLFLLLALRRARAAAVPLLVSVLATLVTLGAMGLTGQPISMYSVILPSLLVTVGVADAVHLVDGVLDGPPGEAYAAHGRACLFTALTTAAGFGAFVTSDVQPIRTLGLFAAFGVLVCFALALLLAPLAGAPRPPQAAGPSRLAAVARWSVSRAPWVLGGAALVAALAVVGVSRLRVDTFWLDAFRPSSSLRQDFAFVDERLGGAFALEVVVDGGAPGALEDPALLARIATFQDAVRRDPSGIVGPVYGPPDLVGEVHAAFAAEGEAAAVTTLALPATREAVAQELLLLDDDDVGEVLDRERRRGRVHVRVRSRPSSEYLALLGRVEAAARAEGLDVRTTGVMKLFSALADRLTSSQVEALLLAAASIGLLLTALLRSLRLGLLALVPNLLPVLITLGAMGFAGVALDIINVLVACVALGISDDDTVHFFLGYERARLDGLAPPAAAERAAAELARPVAVMTGALVAGFLVFCASSTAHLPRFGLIAALAVAAAWACELLVTPALLARADSARTWPRARNRTGGT